MAAETPYPPSYIDLDFGDGTYTFRLNLPEIGELQTKCGAGIGMIYGRVLRGRYNVEGMFVGHPEQGEYYLADLLETIRLGLIGGGSGTVDGQPVTVNPSRARELMAAYVFPARPLNEAWNLAASILTATIIGFDPATAGLEPVKKKSSGRKR